MLMLRLWATPQTFKLDSKQPNVLQQQAAGCFALCCSNTFSLALCCCNCFCCRPLQVLPVYCYDPRFFAASPWGLSKTGPHRAAFLQACVSDLRSSLQQLGSGLLVSTGTPESLIASALEGCADSCLVLTQQEVTSEELAVDAAVRRAVKGRAQLQTLWGPSLYHIDDLPFAQGVGAMPNVFTPFREKVEEQCKVRAAPSGRPHLQRTPASPCLQHADPRPGVLLFL
jgi:deoxyribodipyrimidine photolyase